jgi:serine O-acetyltransferase
MTDGAELTASTRAISATVPDWSREQVRSFYDPSRKLLHHLRAYQQCRAGRGLFRRLKSRWHVVWFRAWSAISGAEIDLKVQIGGGLLLPHPNGIVVFPDVVIGPNCLIFQQVTLGIGGRVPLPRTGRPCRRGSRRQDFGRRDHRRSRQNRCQRRRAR